MTRILLPILLCAAAIGLFVLYTNPTYQTIKVLGVQSSSYDEALTKSAELHNLRDTLLKTRAGFPNDAVAKLAHVLPDNIDNIRLIIDINNIASRHNLVLTGVSLGTVSDSSTGRSAVAVGSSGNAVGSVEVSFSVAATYDNFFSFLQDLEHSLRIVDVNSISFTVGQGDLPTFAVNIRTYWLH